MPAVDDRIERVASPAGDYNPVAARGELLRERAPDARSSNSPRVYTPKSVNARTASSSKPLSEMTTSSTSISTPSPRPTHAYSEIANGVGIRERGHEMAGRSRLRHRHRVTRPGGVDTRLYGGEDFVAADFAKLRDPAGPGCVVNNDAPRFLMPTPNASLRAWLSFADDNNPHAAEALERARKLSHRASDAVAGQFKRGGSVSYAPPSAT